MIPKLLTALALAATLCTGGAAHAAIITFNDPGVVEINNTTQVATSPRLASRSRGRRAASCLSASRQTPWCWWAVSTPPPSA